ncbi:MAG: sulfatase, partial [Verrucomicrobiota bacterium]
MRTLFVGLFGLLGVLVGYAREANIVFIIADDASRHFGEAYGVDWVSTPHIESLAEEGLVFENAYVTTSKCAPCRASLLTGRYPWLIEAGANHQNYFPPNYPAFGESLMAAGIATGATGKLWGPGIAEDANGEERDFGLPVVDKERLVPREPFERFLDSVEAGTSFFYWHGSSDPHRRYESGAGVAAGKKVEDIDRVPAYWPDNETIRNDMLDYATEVERFDSHVGEILEVLEERGLMENTLVMVTSDHGMPFPRVKGHTFDDAHRVPLVMCWPAGIEAPGRRVSELVSFVDLIPTFLEVLGVDPAESGMDLSGASLKDLLSNDPVHDRSYVLIGRERNDVYARRGGASGLGYPTRGIRMGDYLYVRNFEPDRWPCGDLDLGLKDTDASPTKQWLEDQGPGNPYWEHNFGKRPADMLFNVAEDP